MKRWCVVVLVQFVIAPALGLPASQSKRRSVPSSPEALVQSLYRQVVAHPPYGDLEGRDMKIFAPYLSKSLHYKFDLSHACSRDWYRQNPRLDEKAPFAWSESGPFSGGNERESPGKFEIERTQAQKDGSFRIDVKFTHLPIHGGGSWRVEDIVMVENGRFILDEVIYLKGEEVDREYRLSEVIAEGCDGPWWVGTKADPSDMKCIGIGQPQILRLRSG